MFIFLLIIFSSLFTQNIPIRDVDLDRRIFMPRSLSLSGNLNSRINLNESIYFNPASSGHSRCYSIDAGFSWQHHDQIPGRIDNYYINAIDTEGSFFGGGIGLIKRHLGSVGDEWEVKGIVNKPLFKNRLSVGFGLSYISYKHYGESNNNFNVDIGALLLLTSKTILGVTGFNLFGDKNGIKTRSVDIGIRQTIWDFFSVSLDFEHRFRKKAVVTGALELLYKNGMMINISLKRNQNTKSSLWGFGLGYVAPKISFLYGTMNAISAPLSFMHSFSIRVFF